MNELHEKISHPRTGKFWLDLNPITKLVLMICGSILSICDPGFYFGFVLLAFYWILSIWSGKGKVFSRIMIVVLVVFIFLLIASRALFDKQGEIILTIGSVNFYKGGLMKGLASSSAIMGFCSSIVFFANTTDPEYMMLSLEKYNVSPRATYVYLSIFQMIPQMSINATVIQNAQRARCIETEGKLKSRVRAFIPMLLPLFLSSFTMAEEKSLALETRGFNYDCKKTRIRLVEDTKGQKIARIITVAVSAVACVLGGYFKWLA